MSLLIGALALVFAALSPTWLSLTLWYPIALFLSGSGRFPPVVTVGTADIGAQDVLMAIVIVKILMRVAVTKRVGFPSRSLVAPIAAMLGLLWVATLLAWAPYSPASRLQVISLTRLSLEALVYPLVVLSVRDMSSLRGSVGAFRALGFLAAASIVVSAALQPWGIALGEVSPVGEEYRFQGLLGDTVKIFLIPFFLLELSAGRPLHSAYYLLAILLTGGRYGLAGLLLGVAALVSRRGSGERRLPINMGVLFGVIVVGQLLDLGGMGTRIFDSEPLLTGIGQRLATWKTSLMMFGDNFVGGLGFAAYSLHYLEYASPVTLSGQTYYPFLSNAFSQVLKNGLEAGFLAVGALGWLLARALRIFDWSGAGQEKARPPFVAALHAWMWALVFLSPFLVWMQPGSLIAALFWISCGLGTVHAKLRAGERPVNPASAAPADR